MTKLPNGEHAEIGTKLEDYVLNRHGRDGSAMRFTAGTMDLVKFTNHPFGSLPNTVRRRP